MQTISPPEITTHSKQLKRGINNLINQHLNHSINPYWLISLHYAEGKIQEQEVLKDIQDLKRKLQRIIYQSRDKSIKGAGEYPYPKMFFFHEISHQGTGQYHSHIIIEKLPPIINTQAAVEHLFSEALPSKVKSLSKWKSIDIQRIHPDPADYKRISNYLCKQITPEHLALEPFASDLTPSCIRPRVAK